MDKDQVKPEIRSQIIEKLNNFAVNPKAKTAKPFLYAGLMLILFAFVNLSLILPNNLGLGSFEFAKQPEWWNIVLATLFFSAAIYCGIKGLSAPFNIGGDLKAASLKNMLIVAEYNPAVRQYIEDNKKLTNRDYYFLNIDNQIIIINNLIGSEQLQQMLQMERPAQPEELVIALQEIKTKPLVPQKDILIRARNAKSKAFVFLGLFVTVLLAAFIATIFDMPFTPLIRGVIMLICFILLILMVVFFGKSASLKDGEAEYIGSKAFDAVNKVCLYNHDCRNYIELVLKEERPLLERDLDAMQIHAQLEKINFISLRNKKTA